MLNRKLMPRLKRRTEQIGVRLTPAEREALMKAALAAGEPLSEYVRAAVLRALEAR